MRQRGLEARGLRRLGRRAPFRRGREEFAPTLAHKGSSAGVKRREGDVREGLGIDGSRDAGIIHGLTQRDAEAVEDPDKTGVDGRR
jgi:hypothetical protein